jgi:hypothetical protein
MIRINERERKILVSSLNSIEEIARIIDEYSDEYRIYIGDEFDEDTDIEW